MATADDDVYQKAMITNIIPPSYKSSDIETTKSYSTARNIRGI